MLWLCGARASLMVSTRQAWQVGAGRRLRSIGRIGFSSLRLGSITPFPWDRACLMQRGLVVTGEGGLLWACRWLSPNLGENPLSQIFCLGAVVLACCLLLDRWTA